MMRKDEALRARAIPRPRRRIEDGIGKGSNVAIGDDVPEARFGDHVIVRKPRLDDGGKTRAQIVVDLCALIVVYECAGVVAVRR